MVGLRVLARLHDKISLVSFWLGGLSLAAIVVIFCSEVTMRYFFNAPLRWATDTVSLLLLSTVFLVAPWLTRDNGHVAITMLPDLLPEKALDVFSRLIFLISALACFAISYILLVDTARVFERGLKTLATIPMPRWPFAALICYGIISSGLYFLRLGLSKHVMTQKQAMVEG